MKLRVEYSAQLRRAIGRVEEELDLPEVINLAEMLRRLAIDHGRDVAMHLLTSAGEIQPSLLLVVNGTAVSACDATAFQLKSGDMVMLMPPIAGG